MSETVNTAEAPKPGTKPYLEAQLAAEQAEKEAMKAELDALRAEKEARESMAGAAKAEPVAPAAEEKVAIFVPRISGNTDPNLIIVLNGKNYVMPRGQTSVVPKAVAEEYERAQRAQHKVDNAIFAMVEKAKQQALAAGIK